MSVLTESGAAPADTPSPAAPPTRRPRHWGRIVLPTYSWLVIAYLVFPIVVMIIYSFNKSVGGVPQVSFSWNGFTNLWYREWNSAPGLSASFWLSIRLALIATAISTILGTLLAMALVRYRPKQFRGKGVIEQVLFINIAAPEIVMGASLLGLFVTFNIGRGFLTLVLAHVMFCIAYVAVTVRARLAGFDRSLEEASYDLGAGPFTTFRRVTLPMIMPGVLAGALMAFALSIDDFITSNFVSGTSSPFPVLIYASTRVGIPPQVFVFGTVIFAVGIVLALSSLVIGKKGT